MNDFSTTKTAPVSRADVNPPAVVVRRDGANVSFLAGGMRVITRPGNQAAGTGRALDALFVGDAGYEAAVAAEFATWGVTVSEAEVKAALNA